MSTVTVDSGTTGAEAPAAVTATVETSLMGVHEVNFHKNEAGAHYRIGKRSPLQRPFYLKVRNDWSLQKRPSERLNAVLISYSTHAMPVVKGERIPCTILFSIFFFNFRVENFLVLLIFGVLARASRNCAGDRLAETCMRSMAVGLQGRGFSVLVALVAVRSISGLSAPQLDNIWPGGGSIAGGTYIIFKGSGFGRNGESGFTKAYINGKECRQNQGIALDRFVGPRAGAPPSPTRSRPHGIMIQVAGPQVEPARPAA